MSPALFREICSQESVSAHLDSAIAGVGLSSSLRDSRSSSGAVPICSRSRRDQLQAALDPNRSLTGVATSGRIRPGAGIWTDLRVRLL